MRSKKAAAFLADVTRYIHGEGQKARTQDEHEDFTVALRILKAIREGWTEPVNVAYYYTFGLHPDKYRRKRLERHAHLAWQLTAATFSPAKAASKLAKVFRMPAKKVIAVAQPSTRKHAARGAINAQVEQTSEVRGQSPSIGALPEMFRKSRAQQDAM